MGVELLLGSISYINFPYKTVHVCPSTSYSKSEKTSCCLLFGSSILSSQIFGSHADAFSKMSKCRLYEPGELYSHFIISVASSYVLSI